MPNASSEVGGLDLNKDARRGMKGGGGGHKNLFCFFVPTVAFQRYQIAGASSALGVVPNSFWDRPWSVLWRAAFLFFTPPPRCTFPLPPPSRLPYAYVCVHRYVYVYVKEGWDKSYRVFS